MSDQATTEDTRPDQADEKEVVPVSEVQKVANEPVVPEGDHITSGDENLPEPREPQVIVQDSYVTPAIKASNSGASVSEMHVIIDEVITDPLGPLGVQIPDAGVGFLDLPLHDLAKGTPTQQLARSEADDS